MGRILHDSINEWGAKAATTNKKGAAYIIKLRLYFKPYRYYSMTILGNLSA